MSAFRAIVCLLGVIFVVVALDACTTRSGPGGGADVARGTKYFTIKCNACHPNGGQGAGPPLIGKVPPGPLKRSSSGGRHNVPDAEFDSLLAYIAPMMQPQASAPMVPAVPSMPMTPAGPVMPAVPMTPAAPLAPPGMKTCNCTCQCPIGTPPGQMQACTCACACPPG